MATLLNSLTLGQWIGILFQILLAPVLVSVLVYFLVRWLKRWLRGTRPKLLAALAFILVLMLQGLPSLAERRQFHQEVMEEASHPWVRVPWYNCSLLVNDPLATLLYPLDKAYLVMPESSSSSRFRYTIYQLNEAPVVSLVEPDCDDGTLQDDTSATRDMSSDEAEVFCSDWTKEKQALEVSESGEPQIKQAEDPCRKHFDR